MEGYYQNIISKHSTTKERLSKFFQMYSKLIQTSSNDCQTCVTTGKYKCIFTDLADNINPNGGNLDIEKLRTTLEADRECRLDQMQQECCKKFN